MIERVLLVAWKGSSATAWVETLRAGGYTVLLEDTTGERAWRTAKERGIDVVVIDGQKKPSHGRQTGHALRDTAKTRNIPIIWTNLDVEDVASVNAEVRPDVALDAPTDARKALQALRELQVSRGETPAEPRPELVEIPRPALRPEVEAPPPVAAREPVPPAPAVVVALAVARTRSVAKPAARAARRAPARKQPIGPKKPAKKTVPAKPAKKSLAKAAPKKTAGKSSAKRAGFKVVAGKKSLPVKSGARAARR